jgi:hypothetical protein
MAYEDEVQKINRRRFLKAATEIATCVTVGGILSGCTEGLRIITPDDKQIAPSGLFVPLTGERLAVSPERFTYRIKDTIVFTGKLVDKNGKPIGLTEIGVEDPILQMSRMIGKTDSLGRFTYRVDGFNNEKGGQFTFRFIAGIGDRPSQNVTIAVNAIPEIWRQFVKVNSNGSSKYKVDLTVDGVSLGSRVIEPKQRDVVLWSAADKANHSLKLVCTNLQSGKRYTITPSSHGLRATVPSTCNWRNPEYSMFNVKANNSVNNRNTKNEIKSFTGVARNIYETYINQDWELAGEVVGIHTSTKEGINFDAGISGGLGCSTFLGVQASCSVSCEAGVGLGIGFCVGLCVPTSELIDLGCGLRCGVSVASASCGVGASVEGQATYK